MKKVFFISLFIFTFSLIFYLFVIKDFSGLFRKKQGLVIENRQETEERKKDLEKKKEEKNGESNLIKLIDKGVKGASLYQEGEKIIFYQNQKFFLTDFNAESLSSIAAYPFSEVKKIKWNKDGKSALIKDLDKIFFFDFNQNKAIELKNGIKEFNWDLEGNRIVYTFVDSNGKLSLNLADRDGNNWQIIDSEINFSEVSFNLKPRSRGLIYFPSSFSKTEGIVYYISLDGKDKKKIFEGKFGAKFLFSPDGRKILVSSINDKNEKKISLGLVNENGGGYQGLNFPGIVDKCVWSWDSRFVYCASVSGLPDFAILPDDWNNRKFFSEDVFYKIDTETSKQERILQLEEIREPFDAVNLFLDKNENFLFFIDRRTDSLFRINLKR